MTSPFEGAFIYSDANLLYSAKSYFILFLLFLCFYIIIFNFCHFLYYCPTNYFSIEIANNNFFQEIAKIFKKIIMKNAFSEKISKMSAT